MKLTFNEHSERIHEVFEEENKYMTFSKLCVDTVKGKVVGYSVEEANQAISKKFQEITGLGEKPSKRDVKKSLRNPVIREACFEIIEETIEDTLVSGWQSDPFFNRYVDTKVNALGDKNEFYVKEDCILTVSEIADGHHSLNRQRLKKGKLISVGVKSYGAKVYMELTRFLQGVEDWTELIGKISQAFTYKINNMIHDAFLSAGTTLPSSSKYNIAAPLNSTKYKDFVGLINRIKVATGSDVTIIGTSVALSGLKQLGDVNWISAEAKSDVYKTGRLGTFEGTTLVELPQAFDLYNEDKYLEADDKIFIMPNNIDKFIKLFYEGADETKEVTDTNADDTREYEFKNRFGIEVMTNTRFGTWTITN